MSPRLYMIYGSPACRSVFVTAKAIGVTLDMKFVDLVKGENMKPEFLKLNPQHTVPVLEDEGKTICDSHAIDAYLVDKYAKDDELYPKGLHKRAIVNERLFFNVGALFDKMKVLWALFMTKQVKAVPAENVKAIEDCYSMLEKFLDGNQWVAGDSFTIADIHVYTTVTTMEVHVPVDPKSYPNVSIWLKRVKVLPCFAGDDAELKEYITWFNSLLS